MSYILQALQRAEAERKRGTTPGLDTPATLPGATPEPRGRGALPWLMAGTAAVLGGALVAWWLWPAAPTAAPAPAAMAPAPAVTPAAPAPVPDKPAAAQALPETPIVAAPEPAAPPVAKTEAPRRVASAPAAAAPTQPQQGSQAMSTPAPQAAPAASTATALPSLHDLPPSLRNAMPIINVTGGVYSPEPANRMLIVNGQVLREKALLGQEVVLESIESRSAVFRFRGTRFEVKY